MKNNLGLHMYNLQTKSLNFAEKVLNHWRSFMTLLPELSVMNSFDLKDAAFKA